MMMIFQYIWQTTNSLDNVQKRFELFSGPLTLKTFALRIRENVLDNTNGDIPMFYF